MRNAQESSANHRAINIDRGICAESSTVFDEVLCAGSQERVLERVHLLKAWEQTFVGSFSSHRDSHVNSVGFEESQ